MATRRSSSGSVASRESRNTRRSQSSNLNVFDDDFAEDYAESIHTTSSRRENPFRDPTVHYSPVTHAPDSQAFLPASPPINSPVRPRNSVRKPPLPYSNMGLEEGDHELQEHPANLQSQDVPHRSLSIVSTSSIISHEASSQAGPSHPYTMYPQNYALSRTTSVSTAAGRTGTPSQHRGPAHPYSMYPQTTSSSGTVDSANSSQAIPLGFPGHARQFHRRIGPEGEEQDILGPEGHTEQLPAYSRYPEHYDNKAAAVGLLSSIPEPAEGSGGEPPVELSERMPDDVRQHIGEVPVSNSEATAMVPREGGLSEKIVDKRWSEKNWKGKITHKIIGGVRVWMLLLLLLVIIIIAIVCGGVIGSFLSGAKNHAPPTGPFTNNSPSTSSAVAATTVIITTTRYIGVTPISTPTSISPLPTGSYVITLETPTVSNAACLTDPDQKVAWQCKFPDGQSDLAFDVQTNGNSSRIWLYNTEPTLDYGTQPPMFSDSALTLVMDYENGSMYGPSYQFSMYYDKLVILPQNLFTPYSKAKRDPSWDPTCTSIDEAYPSSTQLPWWLQKKRIGNSDEPWFCWFNNTFINGLIYVNEPQDSSTASEYTATSSSALPYSILTSPSYSISTYQTTLSTSIRTTTSNTNYPVPTPDQTTVAKRDTSSAKTTSGVYPRLVKLEERRLSGSVDAPICTKMTAAQHGGYVPVYASQGSPITFALNETDPSGNSKTPTGCYCQWRT